MEAWEDDDSFKALEERLTSDCCRKACGVGSIQTTCGSVFYLAYAFLDAYLLVSLLCAVKLTVRTTQAAGVFLVCVLPEYPAAVRAVLLAAFALVMKEVLGNMYKVRMTHPGAPPLAGNMQEASCPRCKRLKVERAGHCSACEVCTLRMDRHSCRHYADLVGRCVGLNNLRFYFLWLYWLLLGSILVVAAALYPALRNAEDNSTSSLCASALLCAAALVMARQTAAITGLIVSRLYSCILAGQTSLEAARGERRYDVGAKKNWELVFGKSRFWMFGVSTSGLDIPLTVL